MVTADVVTGAGPIVRHTQTLTPLDGGAVLVEELAVVPAELDDLPRVGSVFEVSAQVPASVVRWFGGGPFESYPDRRAAAVVGLHTAPAGGPLHALRPAAGERRAERRPLVRARGVGARSRADPVGAVRCRVVTSTSRGRSASPGTGRDDLAAATHSDQLVPRPEVVVHVDAAHRGLGTASCGPDTLAEYVLGPGEYRWSYVLRDPPNDDQGKVGDHGGLIPTFP